MTDWTAIVGAVTTLVGTLGAYRLAGRNDEARDQRAAFREAAGRREALAERLEEARHVFQRDTLLELQDELQRIVRNVAQVSLQDQKTIEAQGQIYLTQGDLSDQGMQITVAIQRLRARVLDDELRTAVGDFASMCSAAGIPSPRYPGGKVPDDERARAVADLQAQITGIANAYGQLTDLLGVHLRRELDRRFLVAE